MTCKLWPSKVREGLPLKIYPYHTYLSLLACALLPYVNNPQFYPIWFAQSFCLHLYTWVENESIYLYIEIYILGSFQSFNSFLLFSCDGTIKLVNCQNTKQNKGLWRHPI